MDFIIASKFLCIFALKETDFMEKQEDLIDFLENKQNYIPHLSIDCVVFGFHNNELKVLLLKIKNIDTWVLPGGFVGMSEGIDQAAFRILKERTGLENIYLEQFYTFGQENRSKENTLGNLLGIDQYEAYKKSWISKRFVSIGYYALVDFSKVNPTVDDLTEKYAWFELKQLPCLAFDHKDIIEKALATLRLNLDRKLVGFNLLPETFTMPELQSLYETILDVSLRRNNFQRKILNMDILERIEKLYTGAANKAPYLYKFKPASQPKFDE